MTGPSPVESAPPAPRSPERIHTRKQVIQAFNETFDQYKSRPSLTPEDQAAISAIQSAKEKTIDKGKSRTQNKFPDAVTGEQITTLEGVPVDKLLVFLESKIESEKLSGDDLEKCKERWSILNANKKPFLSGKQLDPSVRLARNQQEAYFISQDARNVDGEVGDWYRAEVELNRRFELVLPPDPKTVKTPTAPPQEPKAEPMPDDYSQPLFGSEPTSGPVRRVPVSPRDRLTEPAEPPAPAPLPQEPQRSVPPLPTIEVLPPPVVRQPQVEPPIPPQAEPNNWPPPQPPSVDEVRRHTFTVANRNPDLNKNARKIADDELQKILNGRNIFRRIKYRVAEEYYRHKFTDQAYSAMLQHGNSYLTMETVKGNLRVLDANAGRANENAAGLAKILEIQGRLEARMRPEATTLVDGPLKQQLLDLIIEPVLKGTITEPQQVQQALATFVRNHADDPKIAQFFGGQANMSGQTAEYFATDLLEMGNALKADYVAHGESTRLMGEHIDIRLACPTWAEAGGDPKLKNKANFIRRVQQRRSTGAIFNPGVIHAMSSNAVGGILSGAMHTTSTVAGVAASGAGALSGALFSAFRRYNDLNIDISSHRRDMARGQHMVAGSAQRERLETFAYDVVSIKDLINGAGVDRQRDNRPRRSMTELVSSDLTVEANQQDLVSRIAEIEARDTYSAVNNVDLIIFEAGELMEQGRLALVEAVVAGKRALASAGVDESRIAVMSASLTHHFETDQADKDKAFKRFRLRSSLASGAFGGVAGLVIPFSFAPRHALESVGQVGGTSAIPYGNLNFSPRPPDQPPQPLPPQLQPQPQPIPNVPPASEVVPPPLTTATPTREPLAAAESGVNIPPPSVLNGKSFISPDGVTFKIIDDGTNPDGAGVIIASGSDGSFSTIPDPRSTAGWRPVVAAAVPPPGVRPRLQTEASTPKVTPTTTVESGVNIPVPKYAFGQKYESDSGRIYEVAGFSTDEKGVRRIDLKSIVGGKEVTASFAEDSIDAWINAGKLEPIVTAVAPPPGVRPRLQTEASTPKVTPTTTAESTAVLPIEPSALDAVVGKKFVSERGIRYEIKQVVTHDNGAVNIIVEGSDGVMRMYTPDDWDKFINYGRFFPEITTAESTVDLGERIDPSKGASSTEAHARHRQRNEDAVVVNTERRFIGVFDGAGGYQGGQEASRIAMEQTIKFLGGLSKTASKAEVEKAMNEIISIS